jgi:hypothetical protein
MPLLMGRSYLIRLPDGKFIDLEWIFVLRTQWPRVQARSVGTPWRRVCPIGIFVLAFRWTL